MEKINCNDLPDTHRIVAIAGRPGSGKTTLARTVIAQIAGSGMVRGWTTRPIRPDEEPGREYDFIASAGFRRLRDANRLLWEVCVHGHRYGTALEQLEDALHTLQPGITIVTPSTFVELRQVIPEKRLTCIYLESPPGKELVRRMSQRNDTANGIKQRLSDSTRWDDTVARQIAEGYPIAILNQQPPLEMAAAFIAILGLQPHLPA
jgi:guanylate kinase